MSGSAASASQPEAARTTRRWQRRSQTEVKCAVGLLVVVSGLAWAGVASGAGSSSSTSSSSPLTVAEWKQHYEAAIGAIADDVVLVVDTGIKDTKHPTMKKAQAILSDCKTWHEDALRIPSLEPPIPLAAAEQAWEGLISASLSASSDCTAAFESGSKGDASGFHKELTKVEFDEKRLTSDLGATDG